ncbi:Chorismate synthase protein [Pleurostoma richardsiae]|uniref:Chorismate synthase protein n=1 Tax=Pleurostoma richardsiae TaxID=41990 RepID=A0AA38R806_9PEZI|nr:Chorismate synthase protein [Pleurostoma richardsiae]
MAVSVSWGTIKSLLIFFGPIIIPKALAYYRSARNAPRIHGLAVQPLPSSARRAIWALSIAAFTLLVLGLLPPWAPENVFRATQSRLQIPTDVLFTRLSALRPGHALTPRDEALRARLASAEARLLYLQFGPGPLADCPFCSSDEPRSFFYYALPSILAPHLANLALLAAATSVPLTGRAGARWRTASSLAGAALAALDLFLVGSYNHQSNSRALRLSEVDFFFWRARAWRLAALAALDALLAWVLYLTATNRAFVAGPGPAERAEGVARALAAARSKLSAVGIAKNATVRDAELRARSTEYWHQEVRLVGEAMEDREVVDGVKDALENRIDIQRITRDADSYAQNVLQAIQQGNPTLVG